MIDPVISTSEEVKVYLWMTLYGNIEIKLCHVAKFTTLTSLPSMSSCKLNFLIVGFEICSLPTFMLKSSNHNFKWRFGNWFSFSSISSWKLTFLSCLLSSFRICTVRKIELKQQPISVTYDIPLLKNSVFLTSDVILLRTKKPVL